MAREDMIRADMKAVGTYNEIFEATIKQLAKSERELSRAEKAWKATGGLMVAELVNKTGATYKAKDPNYTVVEQQRKDITALRNQLGLTPTGLNKARSKSLRTCLGKLLVYPEEQLQAEPRYMYRMFMRHGFFRKGRTSSRSDIRLTMKTCIDILPFWERLQRTQFAELQLQMGMPIHIRY